MWDSRPPLARSAQRSAFRACLQTSSFARQDPRGPHMVISRCYSVAMPRILISGASGLIGSALVPSLESKGYEVMRLVRRKARAGNEAQWDPMHPIPPQLVSGFDVVIHLSAEKVAGRWTGSRKARIHESVVFRTVFLP